MVLAARARSIYVVEAGDGGNVNMYRCMVFRPGKTKATSIRLISCYIYQPHHQKKRYNIYLVEAADGGNVKRGGPVVSRSGLEVCPALLQESDGRPSVSESSGGVQRAPTVFTT